MVTNGSSSGGRLGEPGLHRGVEAQLLRGEETSVCRMNKFASVLEPNVGRCLSLRDQLINFRIRLTRHRHSFESSDEVRKIVNQRCADRVYADNRYFYVPTITVCQAFYGV